jgi:hypothetical protein
MTNQHDPSAFFNEERRTRQPDTARSSGDDAYFTIHNPHLDTPFLTRGIWAGNIDLPNFVEYNEHKLNIPLIYRQIKHIIRSDFIISLIILSGGRNGWFENGFINIEETKAPKTTGGR